MIYQNQPEDFHSKFDVVGCVMECDGKILLLHRQDHKHQGNTWGIPGGKVEEGERLEDAIVREIKEETGMEIPSSDMKYFRKVYVKVADFDFIYHMFHLSLDTLPKVTVNPHEHKGFIWSSPQESLKMNCIQDLDGCLKLFYPELG